MPGNWEYGLGTLFQSPGKTYEETQEHMLSAKKKKIGTKQMWNKIILSGLRYYGQIQQASKLTKVYK